MTRAPETAPKGETAPEKARTVPSGESGTEVTAPLGVTQSATAGEVDRPSVARASRSGAMRVATRVIDIPSVNAGWERGLLPGQCSPSTRRAVGATKRGRPCRPIGSAPGRALAGPAKVCECTGPAAGVNGLGVNRAGRHPRRGRAVRSRWRGVALAVARFGGLPGLAVVPAALGLFG